MEFRVGESPERLGDVLESDTEGWGKMDTRTYW
jgi:hypothetical protein